MAVDLKIELFSLDLFRNLWFKCGLLNFIPSRVKMPLGGDQKSENSAETVHAVWCRQQMFSASLRERVWVDHSSFSGSGVDFYLYVHDHALDFTPYHLNVFDRLLMAAAFVLEMARCLASSSGGGFYLYSAPVSWAMLFDSEMKTEFYEEGGWEALRRCAASYNASVLARRRSAACARPDDCESARLLLESAGELYDLSRISRAFSERCEKRKSELATACSRCLPMSLVLRDSLPPPEWRGVFVEGRLQIMLRMLTEEELALRRDAFLDSLRRADSSDSDGPTDPSEEIPEVVDEAFRSLTASELVDRLFAYEDPLNQKCMFCGRIIGSVGFSECAKVSVHVERIQSAVDKVAGQETCEEPRWDRSTLDLEDTIRLFLCLGLEPMRSQTLGSRPETKERTCEAQLHRSSKYRRAKK